MNADLRHSYRCHAWSQLEVLLQYLRGKNCFQSVVGEPKANPYWYGTIMDFIKVEAEIKSLLAARSIKTARMKEFAESAKNNDLSPIVRLVGFTIERLLTNLPA